MAFERKKWEEAIAHFSDAVKVAPGRPEAWYYRAVSYYNSGEPEKARADMRVAARWFTDDDPRAGGARSWLKALGDNPDIQRPPEGEGKAAKPAAKESAKPEANEKPIRPEFGKPAIDVSEQAGEAAPENEAAQPDESEE